MSKELALFMFVNEVLCFKGSSVVYYRVKKIHVCKLKYDTKMGIFSLFLMKTLYQLFLVHFWCITWTLVVENQTVN